MYKYLFPFDLIMITIHYNAMTRPLSSIYRSPDLPTIVNQFLLSIEDRVVQVKPVEVNNGESSQTDDEVGNVF